MKQDYDRYVEENSEKVEKLTAAVEKLTKDKGMNHSVIIYGNSNYLLGCSNFYQTTQPINQDQKKSVAFIRIYGCSYSFLAQIIMFRFQNPIDAQNLNVVCTFLCINVCKTIQICIYMRINVTLYKAHCFDIVSVYTMLEHEEFVI